MNSNKVTLSKYYDMLSGHDWYYDYSDDHGVWQRGRDASEHLRRIAESNGQEYKDLRLSFRAYYLTAPTHEKHPYPEKPIGYVFHKLQK